MRMRSSKLREVLTTEFHSTSHTSENVGWISREEVSQKSELTTIEENRAAGIFSPCVICYDHSYVARVNNVWFPSDIKDLDDGAGRGIEISDACSISSGPIDTSSNHTVNRVSFCIGFLVNARRVRLQNVAAHLGWRILPIPSRWCTEHLTANCYCRKLVYKTLLTLLILRRHPRRCENEESFESEHSIEDGEWT